MTTFKGGTLRESECLYIRSMGRALRVTAVFTNDDDANAYMAHTYDAVVAVLKNGLILLADKGDRGTQIPQPYETAL